MAVVKKVNGKAEVIANKSVIDHNELSNRDAYGAHPISAIRKLPEKLTELKNKDNQLEQRIANEETNRYYADVDLRSRIDAETLRATTREDDIEDNAQQISLESNGDGTLTFTNYDGETNTVRAGHLVDNVTIKEIENGSKLEVIGVKGQVTLPDSSTTTKTFTASEIQNIINDAKKIQVTKIDLASGKNYLHFAEFGGTSGLEFPLDYPDNDTIEKNTDGNLTIKKVYSDSDTMTGLGTQASPLNAKAIKDVNGTITVSDINNMELQIESIKGVGGYLDPYDFDTTTPNFPLDDLLVEPKVLSLLTQYAMQQIGSISEPQEIWNGTKIINLEDNHVWVLNNNYPDDFSWTDIGESKVNIATTTTAGIVKADNATQGYVNVDTTGRMSLNGFNGIISKVGGVDSTGTTQTGTINTTLNQHAQNIQTNTQNIQTNTNSISNIQAQIKTVELKTDQGATKFLNGNGQYTLIQEASQNVAGTIYYWLDSDGDWNITTVDVTAEVIPVVNEHGIGLTVNARSFETEGQTIIV